MDRALAAQHATLMLVAFAVGALFIGRLSDRLRRRKSVMLAVGTVYLLCWQPLTQGMPLTPLASHALFATQPGVIADVIDQAAKSTVKVAQ